MYVYIYTGSHTEGHTALRLSQSQDLAEVDLALRCVVSSMLRRLGVSSRNPKNNTRPGKR